MRACGACFYYRGNQQEGECYNRPPFIHVLDGPNGLEQLSLRASVKSDDFCSFFGHRATTQIKERTREQA